MKIFSQLISAQFENKASDYSFGTKGRVWFNTGSSLPKFDDGSAVRTFYHTGNTVAIANGGTNITSYTAGDILYCSATNVLSKLAVGSNGNVLTLAAGLPSWAPVTPTFNYAAKTNADTGSTLGDGLTVWTLTDGNNNTATIPAASSNGGKRFVIKLAATTASFNTLTLNRSGSDTFTLADGTTGATSLVMYTGGETYTIQSDGTSVYHVIEHFTHSVFSTAFTSGGSDGLGTLSGGVWNCTRSGRMLSVQGVSTIGTVNANPVALVPPSGFAIDSTVLTSSFVLLGTIYRLAATTKAIPGVEAGPFSLFYDGSNNKVFLGFGTGATANQFDKVNANLLFNSNEAISFDFRYPVSGWKS